MTTTIKPPLVPKPPDRLPADPQEAIDDLLAYQWEFFKNFQNVLQVAARLEALANLTPLNLTISNPPTQAEVQAIATRLDAIVAAAKRVTQ